MKVSVIYDRQKEPEKSEFVEVHYSDLGQIDEAILTHIRIINASDYVENPENLITTAVGKLRYGGELTISATDMLCLADKIVCGNSNINEVREFLYNGRKSISHFEHVQRILEQCGLKIELMNLDKQTNQYLIIARKPNVG